jgi:hypothetical protein
MRVYYLDAPLSAAEVQEIEELMDWEIEQILFLAIGELYHGGEVARRASTVIRTNKGRLSTQLGRPSICH